MRVNFSALSSMSVWGKLARWPLRLLPKGTVMRVLQGRLKGKKWIAGSSNHGCWLGSYEFGKQVIFGRVLRPGQVVFDIGAHVGFYTLLASQQVGPEGTVVAFEPVPGNLAFLKRHLELNNVNNVLIFDCAVADTEGLAGFVLGCDSHMGHLGDSGGLAVRIVTLDGLIAAGQVPVPNVLKLDIEGAELAALRGASQLLNIYHPVVFLATHGRKVHDDCVSLLAALGYRLQAIDTESLEDASEILAQQPIDSRCS